VEYSPSQGCGHAPVGGDGEAGEAGEDWERGEGGEGGEDGEGGESEEGVCLHRDAPHKHAPAGAGWLNPLPQSCDRLLLNL